jgi:hypothetical protein
MIQENKLEAQVLLGITDGAVNEVKGMIDKQKCLFPPLSSGGALVAQP